MCVVSYIKNQDKFYFTSNRDIPKNRKIAIHPKSYRVNNQALIFPKDPDAGGSWIAANELSLGCILNLKDKKEIKNNSSRGIFLINCLTQKKPKEYFNNFDFTSTYPFMMVLLNFYEKKLESFIWDGCKKNINILNVEKNYLWMSSSIYEEKEINQKKYVFVKNNNLDNEKDILKFHMENQFNCSKNNQINTASITQISGTINLKEIKYHDILNNNIESFVLPK